MHLRLLANEPESSDCSDCSDRDDSARAVQLLLDACS